MFKSLSAGAIGIKRDLVGVAELAERNGFQGMHIATKEVQALGVERAKDILARHGLRASAFAFVVDWRGTQEAFDQGLKALSEAASIAAQLGCFRTSTWVPSWSDERPWKENYEFHVRRFRSVARVLAEHGCRLGLEFIGPRTIRANHKYEFIHTMPVMLDLCAEIGPNVGLLLDSWHWYTSHGTVEELERLTDANVVDVHINDAPKGIPIDEQVDNVRCLPGETGVIPITDFLRTLKKMGYTGPVVAEPFSKAVRELPPEEAARVTAAAIDKVFRAAGIG